MFSRASPATLEYYFNKYSRENCLEEDIQPQQVQVQWFPPVEPQVQTRPARPTDVPPVVPEMGEEDDPFALDEAFAEIAREELQVPVEEKKEPISVLEQRTRKRKPRRQVPEPRRSSTTVRPLPEEIRPSLILEERDSPEALRFFEELMGKSITR